MGHQEWPALTRILLPLQTSLADVSGKNCNTLHAGPCCQRSCAGLKPHSCPQLQPQAPIPVTCCVKAIAFLTHLMLDLEVCAAVQA
eukprot:1143203-Pelagomonas_calceolata.AAC.2